MAHERRGDEARLGAPPEADFRRELGPWDSAVVVAGGMLGVGIFANPSHVARIAREPRLILAAWVLGGVLALLGGFAYAEIASRIPLVGGQYTYLARTYHPAVGFLYGVALLFIINGGALAAVAIVFASYLGRSFVSLGPGGVRAVAATVLVALAGAHLTGIRVGKWTNNALMAAKVAGSLVLVALVLRHGGAPVGLFVEAARPFSPASDARVLLTALVPIMFAYGGWQNCGAIAGEIRDPARNLPYANILGVILVVSLYVSLNVAYLWVLTPEEVAASSALAADVAQAVAGSSGSRFVAALILVSALGFLSVITLTGPRLYFAMARDGVFFPAAARLHPRFRTPVVTLALQTAVALVLLFTNTYGQLLSYVVFADWLFFGLTVGGLFLMRRRDPSGGAYRMPGHPVTTFAFVAVAAGIVVNSFFTSPVQSLVGSAILLGGLGVYFGFVAKGVS